MAEAIVVNAKCQRPGVCNAMETLLIHQKVSGTFWLKLASKLRGVEIYADERTLKALGTGPNIHPATESSYDTEYLDLKMNVKVVDSLDEAIAHIEKHGSRHSEAIVTASEKAARRFQGEIDAAAVYWNASTRFTDGFALGLGGEIGISTQKLHARGPVGLRELTSVRWIMDGEGQIRK
jgi:glutamate-5-semialdehyde dehydrogenase